MQLRLRHVKTNYLYTYPLRKKYIVQLSNFWIEMIDTLFFRHCYCNIRSARYRSCVEICTFIIKQIRK